MSFSKHMWSWCTCFCLLSGGSLQAQILTSSSVLGHTPGDDFYLANYEEAVKYFHVLVASSDRMKMFTVGKSSQGRDIEVAVISSPENLARLDEYKKIARQLATADGLNDEQARKLAHDSKGIGHIDGGLHSSEVAGGQHSIALAYKLVCTKNDPDIDPILTHLFLSFLPPLSLNVHSIIVSRMLHNQYTRSI